MLYSFLLMALFFVVPVFSSDSYIYDSDFSSDKEEVTKKCSEYFKFIDERNEGIEPDKIWRRTMVVGTGRNGFYADKPEYFTVDTNKGEKPDVVCDVRNLSTVFSHNSFDVIIFEYIPVSYCFSSAAVNGALDVLKPRGNLYTTGFPRIPVGSLESRQIGKTGLEYRNTTYKNCVKQEQEGRLQKHIFESSYGDIAIFWRPQQLDEKPSANPFSTFLLKEPYYLPAQKDLVWFWGGRSSAKLKTVFGLIGVTDRLENIYFLSQVPSGVRIWPRNRTNKHDLMLLVKKAS